MKNNLPNVLMIGAARCGTTALYHLLKQHPQIFLPVQKELDFFPAEGKKLNFRGPCDYNMNNRAVTRLEKYASYFSEVKDEKAVLEISPWYLYSEIAAERIYHHIPDVKIVVMLRNPVDRAFSHYVLMRKLGFEPLLDFSEALKEEERRIRDNWAFGWHYLRVGLYAEQLKRYYDIFDEGQIKVFLYEEFKKEPDAFFKELFDFIGVDGHFPHVNKEVHASVLPKSDWIIRIMKEENLLRTVLKHFIPLSIRPRIHQKITSINIHKPSVDKKTRRELTDYYRNDIVKLSGLISRDLSAWL